jgi:hypothetical protein
VARSRAQWASAALQAVDALLLTLHRPARKRSAPQHAPVSAASRREPSNRRSSHLAMALAVCRSGWHALVGNAGSDAERWRFGGRWSLEAGEAAKTLHVNSNEVCAYCKQPLQGGSGKQMQIEASVQPTQNYLFWQTWSH